MARPALKTILGQPSYVISTGEVSAAVARQGGHLAPVSFKLGRKKAQPFAIAPWWKERVPAGTPEVLRVLRGDFFCLPFGGNSESFRGEKQPVHGETANSRWRLEGFYRTGKASVLHLSLRTRARPGRVDKWIALVPGETVIYQKHVVSRMTGPMNPGHHATLKFPEREGAGRLSTSPLAFGQVFVEPTERPENRGYSILRPGAIFGDLRRVPTVTGATADLSRYPARRGYEDIVILVADPELTVAWNAVAFPEELYVWFALRDPKVLPATLLWMSNGGRHYPPWNGRHVNVMGVEDICGYFHLGLAASARRNSLSARGFRTSHNLNPERPLTVNYIMGLASIPRGFERVEAVIPEKDAVILRGRGGRRVKVAVDTEFLHHTQPQQD